MIKKAVYLEPSAAKINLFLEVLPLEKQSEYHEIATLYQAIDLRDFLTLEIVTESEGSAVDVSEEIEFTVTVDSNVEEVRKLSINNSVVKAIEAFFVKIPEEVLNQLSKVDIQIFIDKKIPMQAGLAGGSSNAAATLRALAKYFLENFGYECPQQELLAMAEELGSDVPFCLLANERTRLFAQGRGEKFTDIKKYSKELAKFDFDMYPQLIVIKPDFGISTKEAYALLDANADCFNAAPEPGFFNRFEEEIFKKYPSLMMIKQRLIELDIPQVLLSGSGSSMLAFLEKGEDAQAYLQDIRQAFPDAEVFAARFI